MAQTSDQTSEQASEQAEPPPTYEAAREELVDTVRRLEAGGTTLEESLTLWERGEHLATVCGDHLAGARARLEAAVGQEGVMNGDGG